MKINKFKINIRYGYDELYPKVESETGENHYCIDLVGVCDFKNMMFHPEVGENFKFEFNKEFEVKHDIVSGLPVYITVSELCLENNEFKEIDVPLTWVEIDQIVVALRLTNKAFKGCLRDELEEKMSNYSLKAKVTNSQY